MAYNASNDPGKYLQNANPYYSNNYDLIDVASKAFVVTPAAAELPRYAKALEIFVPSGTATATVSVVLLNDADNAPVTLTYGPGNYSFKGFVRRVTAVSGTGVIVVALTD